MIRFTWVVVLVNISMAVGFSICNNATVLNPRDINEFTDEFYNSISKKWSGNLVVTPISVWFLIPKNSARDQLCSELLTKVESRLNLKYPVRSHSPANPAEHNVTTLDVEFGDSYSLGLQGKMPNNMSSYALIRTMSFSGKIHGGINPQLRLRPLPLLNHRQQLVPIMDFFIEIDYNMNLAFNSTFVTIPFEGSEFKLTVVLPGHPLTVKHVSQVLRDAQRQGQMIPESREMKFVHVQLPSFKINSVIDITRSLVDHGFGNLFTLPPVQKLMDKLTGSITAIIQNGTIIVNDFHNSKTVNHFMDNSTRNLRSFIVDRPFLVELSYRDIVVYKGEVVDLK